MAAGTWSPGRDAKRDLLPNVITYNAAISACEKCKQWQQALCLLAEMRSVNVLPDDITYQAAIIAFMKYEQRALALPAES